MLAVDAWICWVELVWVAFTGEQWRDLIISPKRASLAQTLLRERLPRRPAQLFERANISPRREGSRLSEISLWLLVPLSSPRLGEGDPSERDPSA